MGAGAVGAFGSYGMYPKLISGFLNQESYASLGAPLASPSGSIVEQYLGYLGVPFVLTAAGAAKLSDVTNVGTLYEGIYAAVQLKSTFTTSGVARGYPLFWTDRLNYIVTPDITATNAGNFAGICILANAKMVGGNYIFIQKAGRATVKMQTTLTKGTPADGDVLTLDTSTGLFNDLADASTVTFGGTGAGALGIKLIEAIANNGGVAPAGAALVIANLSRNSDNNF